MALVIVRFMNYLYPGHNVKIRCRVKHKKEASLNHCGSSQKRFNSILCKSNHGHNVSCSAIIINEEYMVC